MTLPILMPDTWQPAVAKMAGITGITAFRTRPTNGGFDIACAPVTKTTCTFLRYTSLQSYGSQLLSRGKLWGKMCIWPDTWEDPVRCVNMKWEVWWEGTGAKINNKKLTHQGTTNSPEQETLGLCTLEKMDPRSSKHNVCKIKRNRPNIRGQRDCQESRWMKVCTAVWGYPI